MCFTKVVPRVKRVTAENGFEEMGVEQNLISRMSEFTRRPLGAAIPREKVFTLFLAVPPVVIYLPARRFSAMCKKATLGTKSAFFRFVKWTNLRTVKAKVMTMIYPSKPNSSVHFSYLNKSSFDTEQVAFGNTLIKSINVNSPGLIFSCGNSITSISFPSLSPTEHGS